MGSMDWAVRAEVRMFGENQYHLSWNQNEEMRPLLLKTLWENKDFVDVTIACDDDQIDAHKVVLSAASSIFEKILKRNPHNHPLIYLKGTSKGQVELLLEFIYSGETNIPEENLNEFLELAKSFCVKGLTDETNESANKTRKNKKNSSKMKGNFIQDTSNEIQEIKVYDEKIQEIQKKSVVVDLIETDDEADNQE